MHDAARQAVDLDPDTLWKQTNLVHVSMHLKQVEAEMEMYLVQSDQTMRSGKPWDTTVAEDFEVFKERGHSHPKMGDVLARLAPE